MKQAVILVGGKGVRCQIRFGSSAMPLFSYFGISLILRKILKLKECGLTDILKGYNAFSKHIII